MSHDETTERATKAMTQTSIRLRIDGIIEQATKTMHAEVCCPCDPQGCDWTHTPEARYARALADVGLLALRITRETIEEDTNER